MSMNKIKEVFQRTETKLMVGMLCTLPMSMVAFAAETPADFDIAAIMQETTSKIVADVLKMVGVVLPTVATLLGASITIAYGIKFIKKVAGKAG